jgi:hypothetical protein
MAIGLLALPAAAQADVSKNVQKAMRGKLIITADDLELPADEAEDSEVLATLKKASLSRLKHENVDGVATWSFSFIAFMKANPGATQVSLDFYKTDRKKTYVANKRLAGIDPKLPLLRGHIDITEDDGVNAATPYLVRLTVSVKGKDRILAETKLTLE